MFEHLDWEVKLGSRFRNNLPPVLADTSPTYGTPHGFASLQVPRNLSRSGLCGVKYPETDT